MDEISRVEQLGDSRVDVILGFRQCVGTVSLGRVIREVEVEALAGIRPVVVQPAVPAVPVLMRKDLVKKRLGKKVVWRMKRSLTLFPHVVVEFTSCVESLTLCNLAEGSLAAGIECHPMGLARASNPSFSNVLFPSEGSLTPQVKTL